MNLNDQTSEAIRQHLQAVGFISAAMGIQWNLAVAYQKVFDDATHVREGDFCDHNCVAHGSDGKPRGGYTCPASKSLNPGILGKTLPPAEVVTQWLANVVAGLNGARQQILQESLPPYYERFGVPSAVASVIGNSVATDAIELNCFGANPELWGGLFPFMAAAKELGLIVNLTTTGKRLMRDSSFADTLLVNPSNVLALSMDEVESREQLDYLLGLSLLELKRAHARIPSDFGQAQKAVEAIYAARWAAENRLASKLLFNMVVHPGNLEDVHYYTAALSRELPNVRMNPYPAQTAFLRKPGCFNEQSLAGLEELIGYFIEQTVSGGPVVRRLHYWLMLKAAFKLYGSDSSLLNDAVSGHNTWRCYGRGGAYANLSGLYLQVGQGPKDKLVQIGDGNPGGHVGCFWDIERTVTDPVQIGSAEQVASHLLSGMQSLSRTAQNKCPGCVMPRLCFNGPTTEAGMDPVIISTYLELRRQYAGF